MDIAATDKEENKKARAKKKIEVKNRKLVKLNNGSILQYFSKVSQKSAPPTTNNICKVEDMDWECNLVLSSNQVTRYNLMRDRALRIRNTVLDMTDM